MVLYSTGSDAGGGWNVKTLNMINAIICLISGLATGALACIFAMMSGETEKSTWCICYSIFFWMHYYKAIDREEAGT